MKESDLTHFVTEMPGGKFSLDENPKVIFDSRDELNKFTKLVGAETGRVHRWVIFRDYSKKPGYGGKP